MPADTRLWHPFADMHAVRGAELVITRGEGAYVWDEDGRRYLDGTASLWNVNVGHGRTEIVDAAAAQMRTLASYSAFGSFANTPALRLPQRLAPRAGGRAVRGGARARPAGAGFFCAPGGGDGTAGPGSPPRRYFAAVGTPE